MHLIRLLTVLAALIVAAGVAACGGDDDDDVVDPTDEPAAEETATEEAPAIELMSQVFSDGDPLPVKFTCDGEGVSPPLNWTGVPEESESLALLLQDPDAPGGTFLHWSVYELDPGVERLGTGTGGPVRGALEGANDGDGEGYFPPCPPEGDDPHEYVFTLYALSAVPALGPGAPPGEVETAIEESSIASGELTATYER